MMREEKTLRAFALQVSLNVIRYLLYVIRKTESVHSETRGEKGKLQKFRGIGLLESLHGCAPIRY